MPQPLHLLHHPHQQQQKPMLHQKQLLQLIVPQPLWFTSQPQPNMSTNQLQPQLSTSQPQPQLSISQLQPQLSLTSQPQLIRLLPPMLSPHMLMSLLFTPGSMLSRTITPAMTLEPRKAGMDT